MRIFQCFIDIFRYDDSIRKQKDQQDLGGLVRGGLHSHRHCHPTTATIPIGVYFVHNHNESGFFWYINQRLNPQTRPVWVIFARAVRVDVPTRHLHWRRDSHWTIVPIPWNITSHQTYINRVPFHLLCLVSISVLIEFRSLPIAVWMLHSHSCVHPSIATVPISGYFAKWQLIRAFNMRLSRIGHYCFYSNIPCE